MCMCTCVYSYVYVYVHMRVRLAASLFTYLMHPIACTLAMLALTADITSSNDPSMFVPFACSCVTTPR